VEEVEALGRDGSGAVRSLPFLFSSSLSPPFPPPPPPHDTLKHDIRMIRQNGTIRHSKKINTNTKYFVQKETEKRTTTLMITPPTPSPPPPFYPNGACMHGGNRPRTKALYIERFE